MVGEIILFSAGGFGDQALSFRLSFLLKQLYPNLNVLHKCCCRDETWEMINIVYGQRFNLLKLKEHSHNNIIFKSNEFLVYPDKLFRGNGAPLLNEWKISNFVVKQTRVLLDRFDPQNRITINLNSITNGYTYHSIPELVRAVADSFKDTEIYVPLISNWNGISLDTRGFGKMPKNVNLVTDPLFRDSYDLLCKSKYLIVTDSGIMHLGYDIGIPMLVLDPRYNQPMFEVRWRPFGYYNSVPISTMPNEILKILGYHLLFPETQMVHVDSIFRKKINDPRIDLLFKE
jgi:hypothetical protein